MSEFVVVTGNSGAGRSHAANVLEDLGWFVIDNLPPALMADAQALADLAAGERPLALVADLRGGSTRPPSLPRDVSPRFQPAQRRDVGSAGDRPRG